MNRLIYAPIGVLLLASNALSADFQSCTSIKLAKDRLQCFDRFAVKQMSEAEAEAEIARKAAEEKAQQDTAATSEKAGILTAVDRFKTSLTARFKDPSSAQFRNVVAYGFTKPYFKLSYLCGEVNGKNSYGAYNGFKRFFMIGIETPVIEDEKNTNIIDTMWPTTCKGNEIYRQE